MIKPKYLPADDAVISKIVEVLNSEKIKKVITTDITRSSEFGLKPPYIYAFFGHRGLIDEFFIGKPNPAETGVYLYKRGLDAIFLVSKDVASALSHDLYSLRSKVPFEIDRDKLSRIVIKRRKDTLDINRTTDGWFMHSPIKGRCSTKYVNKLIEDICTVHADEFFDDKKPNPERFPNKAWIELYEGPDRRILIDVYYWGTTPDTGILVYQHGLSYYARVGRDFWNSINREAPFFKYRNLFEFNPEQLIAIKLKDKDKAWIINKKDNRWLYKDRILNRQVLGEFIELLLNAEAYSVTEKTKDQNREAERFSLELLGADNRILGMLKVYGEAPLNRYAFAGTEELKAYYAESANLKEQILITNLQIKQLKEAFMKLIQEVTK